MRDAVIRVKIDGDASKGIPVTKTITATGAVYEIHGALAAALCGVTPQGMRRHAAALIQAAEELEGKR